jgi:arylsulfatase A-like enzyme
METRRTIDRESADKAVAFMERSVRERKPFFVYYPMTQIHFPTLTHPDFVGKTGAGDIADAMAELDFNVGRMLDAIDRLGITRNTVVFWCSDNGAEGRRPWRGSSGPSVGLLQQRDGRRHPHAVHRPLAGTDPGRPRQQRTRTRDRFPANPGRRGECRDRSEGSCDRRRQPASLLRGQAGDVEPASRCCSTPIPSSAR